MVHESDEASHHYALVARAIAFIRSRVRAQPTLEEIAAAVHVSPYHLQRQFAEWAGISPKRFLQYLTKRHARARLRQALDNLAVAEDVGLSSTSRLHDLMVSCEAMTPGEIKRCGLGLTIGFGVAPSPFGEALVGWTPRGVCHFAFRVASREAMVDDLVRDWPKATLARDDARATALMAEIFPETPSRGRVHLVLRGTNFQIKVWEALLRTASGELLTYGRLAGEIGSPRAQRAVGSAVAANHIGYLIPCHRVIREGGDSGEYRWGPERKLAMLAWEAGRRDSGCEEAGHAVPACR